MANITATMVKELREMTGAGMMDCKKALSETDGDMDAAVEFLRKNFRILLQRWQNRQWSPMQQIWMHLWQRVGTKIHQRV